MSGTFRSDGVLGKENLISEITVFVDNEFKLCFYILKLFPIAAGVKGRVSFACDGVKMHIEAISHLIF